MADIGVPGERFAFDEIVWEDEVGRFDDRADARGAATRAREEIERSGSRIAVRACDAEGSDGTRLVGCAKVYLPLGREPSRAPWAFVFEFGTDSRTGRVVLGLLAFGERHPPPGTRSVYERAHKRLHRRSPDQ